MIQKNLAKNTNGPFQGLDTDLSILYWNAGGLSNDKFLQFKRSICQIDVDLYVIVEAGAATEFSEFYQTTGYCSHILPRSRQVASGIIVGIKNNLCSKFEIIHEMQDDDKVEIILAHIWKNNKHFTVIGLYLSLIHI